jgi:hypothetical protein
MAQPASTVEVPLGAAEPGAIVFREFVGMEGIPNKDGAATPSHNRLPIMPTLRQGARMAHSSSPAAHKLRGVKYRRMHFAISSSNMNCKTRVECVAPNASSVSKDK